MNPSNEMIALFLPGLYQGGAERVFLNLAEGITARGYRVDLVLARAEGSYMGQIPETVRLVDLNAPRVLGSVPALVNYLKREKPTAMLSALFANIIALWAKQISGINGRLVISEHNPLSSVVGNTHDLRWMLYPALAKKFYPWADAIVAVSQDVAKDLCNVTGIPATKIEVVYNPIITPDLKEKSEEQIDHPWFKNGEPPVILAVGRLTDQKAFDVLIHGFSLVRKEHHARLLILGEGEKRPALEALIKKLALEQDVQLMGFVQNPYPYMANASLFVLPSRWEGLPTVLVEALYLGLQVIATDCPGGSKEILQNGRYGRLIPVDDPGIMAAAIVDTMNKHKSCPLQESWNLYTTELVVDRYLNLLLER